MNAEPPDSVDISDYIASLKQRLDGTHRCICGNKFQKTKDSGVVTISKGTLLDRCCIWLLKWILVGAPCAEEKG